MTGWQYARQVLANSGPGWQEKHPDVNPDWVVRAIAEPNHQERDGDDIYYSWIPEAQRWLKVVVENDRIATAFIDRRLLRLFGVPDNG
jgi:hypothetical protein